MHLRNVVSPEVWFSFGGFWGRHFQIDLFNTPLQCSPDSPLGATSDNSSKSAPARFSHLPWEKSWPVPIFGPETCYFETKLEAGGG